MDSKFKIGDKVRIKSEPDSIGMIKRIQESYPQNKIDVFINNKTPFFYEEQLELLIENENYSFQSLTEFTAFLTALHINNPSLSNLYSLHSARVDFIPFQFKPVIKIIKADRPRILIADEVGIGKTIEAGLILKELSSRIEMKNVLVICPKPLVVASKWKNEMKRFDENFKEARDSNTVKYCLEEYKKEGKWPDEFSRIIIPYSLLNDNIFENIEDLNPPIQFDLVIIDEAHRIKNPNSKAHQYVKYFTDNSESVVFLTATPIQMANEDLFTLLKLLRSDLYSDSDSLRMIVEPNRFINNAIELTRVKNKFSKAKIENEIKNICNTTYGSRILSKRVIFKEIIEQLNVFENSPEFRVELRRKFESLNTLNNVINRTRRIDIGQITIRRSNAVQSKYSSMQRKIYDLFIGLYRDLIKRKHNVNSLFFISMIMQQASSSINALSPFLKDIIEKRFSTDILNSEEMDQDQEFDFYSSAEDILSDRDIFQQINALVDLGKNLTEDTKLDSLFTIINKRKNNPDFKVIIFSSFLRTIDYLYKHLNLNNNRVAKITGSVDYLDRIEINKRFRLPKNEEQAIDILILSDVGCEGLDYEFCDTMINYDIPWNPMKIEQRIGRIDRYGQKSKSVNIFNLIVEDTIDAEIYRRCLERIGVFKSSIGGVDDILGDITKEIRKITLDITLTEKERNNQLDNVVESTLNTQKEELELEKNDQELFSISLPKKSIQEEISEYSNQLLTKESIENLIQCYLKSKVKVENIHKAKIVTLRLNDEQKKILSDDFKKLPLINNLLFNDWKNWLRDNSNLIITFTFDEEIAKNNRSLMFLTPVHPFVKQASNHYDSHLIPRVVLKAKVNQYKIPVGNHYFTIYKWLFKGIKNDVSIRFFANSPELETALKTNFIGLINESEFLDEQFDLQNDFESIIDQRHQELFSKEKKIHIDKNKKLIDEKISSLDEIHSRRKDIQIRLSKNTNEQISRLHTGRVRNLEIYHEKIVSNLNSSLKGFDINPESVCHGLYKVF